jgi:phosphate transport system substrate-binding protein
MLFKTKMKKWLIVPTAIIMIMALVVGGCSNGNADTPNGSDNGTIAGVIDEAGSTSVQPLLELLANAFMEKYPDVTINISGGGSSAGVKACASGTVDVGAASRDIKMSEADLIAIPIARDAVAIVVNEANPLSELTMEQVAGIYAGEITNWSEVGGNSEEIVVVSREEGSGTRDCFESKLMDKYDKEIKPDALVGHDADAARKIAVEDDEVDQLYDQVFRELLSFMAEDPKTITRATRLIWVAHNLERSADRVTNICERIVFLVTGKMEEIGASKY